MSFKKITLSVATCAGRCIARRPEPSCTCVSPAIAYKTQTKVPTLMTSTVRSTLLTAALAMTLLCINEALSSALVVAPQAAAICIVCKRFVYCRCDDTPLCTPSLNVNDP